MTETATLEDTLDKLRHIRPAPPKTETTPLEYYTIQKAHAETAMAEAKGRVNTAMQHKLYAEAEERQAREAMEKCHASLMSIVAQIRAIEDEDLKPGV